MNGRGKRIFTLLLSLVFGVSSSACGAHRPAADGENGSKNSENTALYEPSPLPEEAFAAMTVKEGELIADGISAGRSYGGIALDSDRRLTFTDGGMSYTLEEARENLGVQVMEDEWGGEVIISPFGTARLIVRAETAPKGFGTWDISAASDGLYILRYPSVAAAYAAYKELTAADTVIWVEPDSVCAAMEDCEDVELVKDYTFSESELGGWGAEVIGAKDFCTDLEKERDELPEVVVAIVDTGINFDHIFLKDRILGDGANFSGDGSGSAMDKNGHGSHCAGIVTSSTAYNVKILPVKALDDRGNGSIYTVYSGIRYAVDMGVDVISMSLGFYGRSNLLEEAVKYAEDAGIAVCIAAGNEYKSDLAKAGASLPMVDYTITVASLGRTLEASGFSNRGPIDFAAPGEKILSSYAGDETHCERLSGTSMATPFVAACFADMFTYDDTFTVDEAYELLKANTLDVCEKGYDNSSGWGMVNLRNFRFETERIEAPTADYRAGCYEHPISVSLSCDTEGAEIFYTTDGSVPTADNGILYSGEPVEIAETTFLRAVAVLDGKMSRYEEFRYYINDFDPENIIIDSNGILWEYDSYDVKLDLKKLVESGRIQPFTAVGNFAFQRCSYLEEIILPDEVTIIGKSAFNNCPRLRSVTTNAAVIQNEAFSYCADLTEFNDSNIRLVKDNAFNGCTRLEKFDGTQLTAIANRAFGGCSFISLDSFDTSKIESYGYDCFSNSGIRGRLDASAASFVGVRAFENTHLTEVILSAAIETIPDSAFKGCSALTYISAPNLKAVDSRGLALGKGSGSPENVVKTDIDFSQLISAKSLAFDGFVFDGAQCFSSLDSNTTLEAFGGAYATRLTFPNMERLTVDYEKHDIYADIIDLPRLNSFGSRNALGHCGAVVIGGENEVRLNDIREELFSPETLLFTYRENDDVKRLAQLNGCGYETAPAVYCPTEHYIMQKGENAFITAYAIGDGLRGEWYIETENGMTWLENDSDSSILHKADKCGSTTYIFRVTDDDHKVMVEKRIIADVIESDLPTVEIAENGFDIIGGTEFYESAMEGCVLDSGYTLYRGRFTAETGGKYTIDTNRIKVNCSENGRLVFTAGSDGKAVMAAEFEAGKTYDLTILLCPEQYKTNFNMKGLPYLAIHHTDDSRRCIAALYNSYSIDWEGYNGETEFVPYIYLADSGKYLSRGWDYEILFDEPTHYGKNSYIIRGIGNYYGILDIGEAELEENLKAEEWYIRGDERHMNFYPEEDGLYRLVICPSEEALDRAVRNGVDLNYDVFGMLPSISASVPGTYGMTYFKPATGQISKGFSMSEDMMTTVFEVKRGGEYSISAGDRGNRYMITQRTTLSECIAEYPKNCPYSGEPVIPDIRLRAPDGRPLTENTDYTVRMWNNTEPGIMYAYLEGIGDYRGGLMIRTVIEGGNIVGEENGEMRIIPNGIVSLSSRSRYELTVEEDSYLTVTNTVGGFTTLTVSSDSGYREEFEDGIYNILLPAGTYHIDTGSSEGEAVNYSITLKSDVKDIADADINISAQYGTDDEPDIRIEYDGKLLKYGTDYGLDFAVAEDRDIPCVYIWGKGEFGNEVCIEYTAFDDKDGIDSILPNGKSTVSCGTEKDDFDGVYRWFPEESGYVLSLDGSYEQLYVIITEVGGKIISRGELSRWSELTAAVVPEKEYRVRFIGDSKFSFTVDVSRSRTPLSSCERIYSDTAELGSELSPVTFTDGGGELVEGTDYIRLSDCGQIGIGTFEFVYEGIGDYYGTVCVPVQLYTKVMPEETPYDLTENFIYRIGGNEERPGILSLLRFTAQHGGTAEYSLSVMTTGVDREAYKMSGKEDPERCRTSNAMPAEWSSVFVYDESGNYIGTPETEGCLTLRQGETRYIAVITPYVWDRECTVNERELDVQLRYVKTVSEPSLGDVNGDGFVNAIDASAVLVAYSKTSTGLSSGLTCAQSRSADVNRDGSIDARDASAILVYYAYASTASGNLVSLEEFVNSGR